MSQNKEAENLDDIFLIKDKNKPKTNKERSSEEKARETKQIVDKADCKIKPNTLHKKTAETLMVID